MGNLRVKKWNSPQSDPDQGTVAGPELRSGRCTTRFLRVLLVLTALLWAPLVQAEKSDKPQPLRTGIESAVNKLVPVSSRPDGVRILVPDDASELERYGAALARFYISGSAACDRGIAPLSAAVPQNGLPSRLKAKSRWVLEQHQPEPATGFLLRIDAGDGNLQLSAGLYTAESGQRSKTFQSICSLPKELAFLKKAKKQTFKQDNHRWMELLKRLFPACSKKKDAKKASLLAEACHFFQRGFWKQAAGKLSELPHDNPEKCILYHVMALHMAGEDDAALKQVEAAIKRQPDSGPLYALKTWLLQEEGNTSDALMILQQARLSDVQREGMYHLARHFIGREMDKTKMATEAINKATNAAPDNSYVQLMAAEFFWNTADLEASVKHYRAAIDAGVNTQKVWAEYGVALDALGKSDRARRAFRKAFELQPANNSVARQLSALLRAEGRYEKALQVLSRAARKGPDTPAMYMAWGDAASTMWRTNEALRAYRRAVEKDGAAAKCGLADLYMRKRLFQKARTILEGVINNHPQCARARILRAEILKTGREYKKALEVLQKALDETDQEVPIRLARARMYSAMGQHEKAISEAQVAVAAAPSGKTYSTLANMFTANGQYSKARSALDLGKKKEGQSPQLLNACGRLYAAENKLKKALKALQESLQLDPHQPRVLILVGDIHKQQGKIDQCARDWSRASGMDRWNPHLEWRIAELLRSELQSAAQSISHYTRHAELDGKHAARARKLVRQIKKNNPEKR